MENEINSQQTQYKKTDLRTAVSVLSLISMIFSCLLIIPMIWMIPMTLSIRHDVRDNKEIPIALSICYMIFGLGLTSLAAGICALVDHAEQKDSTNVNK